MDDRHITLIIVFGIIACLGVVVVAVAIVGRRRARSPAAIARARAEITLLDDVLSDNRKICYEGSDQDFRRPLRRLPEATLVSYEGEGSIQRVRFRWRGYEFEIDSNSHGGCSLFTVNDASCPDEMLRDVACHFDVIPQL